MLDIKTDNKSVGLAPMVNLRNPLRTGKEDKRETQGRLYVKPKSRITGTSKKGLNNPPPIFIKKLCFGNHHFAKYLHIRECDEVSKTPSTQYMSTKYTLKLELGT